MTALLPPGEHPLPDRFHGPVAIDGPRRVPRRPRRRLVAGILSGAAVVAALATIQVTASLGYDTAADAYEVASASASSSKSTTRADDSALQDVTDAATAILAIENEAIAVDAALQEALNVAVGQAADASASADELLALDVPRADPKPVWFWDLFVASADLDARTDRVEGLSGDLTAASAEIAEASADVVENGVALIAGTGAAATAFEAAHISARNDAVIALRESAADAAATTTIDDLAVTTYRSLQDAASLVIATEAEELGEKSGPLMTARLEVESFARSLAPGVLLEFDWSPVVNGAGFNGSMGGYTTWWWDDPGRSVIQLSNSVAEQWPADRSKALVAHEVGHAISVKCEDMYDSSTQDSIEKWATAWAISMGFTDDANGVWAYGYPPQNYIDAAAGCR